MITFCGPAAFGAAIGYIMMNMFVVNGELQATWKGITTFIATALSAVVLYAFPQTSDAFFSYTLGIGIGAGLREYLRITKFDRPDQY